MKIVLVNCSDENFIKQRMLNNRTAKLFGGFDEIHSFSTDEIDPTFKAEHEKILSQKRGAGYWLWKPYFVNKVYQQLNEGDYLFYCDAGALFVGNIKYFVNALEEIGQSVLPFELPLIEYEWTAENVLRDYDAFNTGAAFTNQICGGYVLLKKCHSTNLFIERWLVACQRPEHITDDVVLGKLAKAHRHDQSIFSLVCKEFKLKPLRDPSDYGRFPHRYFSSARIFRVNQHKKSPVIVLSYRKHNPFVYLLKYLVRVFLSKFLGMKNGI